MLIEVGHFAVILALVISLIQCVVPLLGAHNNQASWIAVAKPAALLQFLFVLLGFIVLSYGFYTQDFSVSYIAQNSNSALPWYFRISAVWSAHEGSLLLWCLILTVWTLAVSLFSQSLSPVFVARVLGVMGLISFGFLCLLLFTSNPFERLIPAAVEGNDLNPLLQDIGLIIHPPILYMGYVGFSVAFSFAIAALLSNRLDSSWARWSRPWTLAAWAFLSLGIGLGSWWAYYELGWGGWWFWDPVENASFMPWLVGTALIHSLAVSEKRGVYKSWTVLLAIIAFSLSLLGTFLVRSGVLTSVHSFATDPIRGVAILIFLSIIIGGSLFLYALRANQIRSVSKADFLSKETFLLCNNVILVTLAAVILLGTLYPLFLDALSLGKVSVGPPYFNTVTAPLFLLLSILMGVGTFARWKSDDISSLKKRLLLSLQGIIFIGLIIISLVMGFSLYTMVGLICSGWLVVSCVTYINERLKNRTHKLRDLFSQPLSFYGMLLGHFGFALCIAGVTLLKTLEVENDLSMAPNSTTQVGPHEYHFNGITQDKGPNYSYVRGSFDVLLNGKVITTLQPEKRRYLRQQSPMTEAAIEAGFLRDLYISLGEPLSDDPNGVWSVRIYYKPFIRWIWLGALFMFVAGFVSLSDKRYVLKQKSVVKETFENAGLTE